MKISWLIFFLGTTKFCCFHVPFKKNLIISVLQLKHIFLDRLPKSVFHIFALFPESLFTMHKEMSRFSFAYLATYEVFVYRYSIFSDIQRSVKKVVTIRAKRNGKFSIAVS